MQNYGEIASTQAGMIDKPALSYGLFHLQGKPNKLYGLVTTGFTMQGLNMDIGHLRHIRWVNDDNPQSAINNKPELTQNGKSAAQNRWIIYNKTRGHYNSAMEYAIPEEFWVNKNQCKYIDEDGQTQNSAMSVCAQAVSSVKALALAQSQGQRIYTINKDNRDTALSRLAIGGAVGSEIRSAIQAGMEVTFHESAITESGWTGYGYIIADPETGAGAYLIEGGGNGDILFAIGIFIIGMIVAMLPVIIVSGGALILALGPLLLLGIGALMMGMSMLGLIDRDYCRYGFGLIIGTSFAVIGGHILSFLGLATLPTNATALQGITALLLGSSGMRAASGYFGFLISDGICPG